MKVELFRLLRSSALFWRKRSALMVMLLVFIAAGRAQTNNPPGTNGVTEFPDDSALLPGLMVYQKNCVMCHGRSGDGRGEMGLTVQPRPRDFRKGIFKFRSTPAGFLPRTEDLKHTIRTGLSGTAMPVFDKLPERDVRAVIEYIKMFSPRWRKPENFSRPLEIPRPPNWFDDVDQLKGRVAKGKALFAPACAACHGDDGNGQGPSAALLEDSFGQPCPPSDLPQPILRCGRELPDFYRVLATGFDGTPMLSFAEAFTPEQRWEIVAFAKSLQKAPSD